MTLRITHALMSILKEMLFLSQEKEEDVKSGAVSAALKTPLINWSAPAYQKTVIVLIALNVICLICGCLYEVSGRKFFKGIKNKIKPESIRMNNKLNSRIIFINSNTSPQQKHYILSKHKALNLMKRLQKIIDCCLCQVRSQK